MTTPLWTPTAEQKQQARLTAFTQRVRERHAAEIESYDDLWQWSVEQREKFWAEVWDFCQVTASRRWDEALVDGDRMPGAQWFVGARLNFAENLLRFRDDRPAIVFWNERGRQRALTYAELYEQVARLAAALRACGVQQGDRVAALLPNMPETIIAMLATASIGAVFSSCSPDFGVPGVVDRFGQIEPKVLLAADGYVYGGKELKSLDRVQAILDEIPSVETTVIVPYLSASPEIAGIRGGVLWNEFTADPSEPIEFAQLPFDHPLYILFSSGTTGVPKCIVHGAGGTLLQHLKEHVLHCDVTRDDRLFYFTTCGWMMWNWLASGLASGCTLLLYDGSPFYPSERILFDLAEAERMTTFGTSAKYLSALELTGFKPRETHRLESLRAMLSTGSPLSGEGFDFVYRDIKPELRLSSISGGTDIVSCFVLGCPTLPVWRGEIQARGLGMDVAVFDDAGQPLVGEKGELVCRSAFPAMPVGFWNDSDGSKYRAAYFERFDNVWCHGDYCELTEHGGVVIYGRSDAVLNPGGVRIGTAEIYRQVEQLPEVLESIAVGQDWQGDVRIVLFVRLAEGVELTPALVTKIRRHVRAGTTPRHVPAKVLSIDDIPRTRSGKIVELAVRQVIHDRPVANLHALANPAALDQYRNRPELES